MQFVWSPSNPQQSVVVLELGQLYTGLLRNKLQPVHSNRIVACVAWSPDGQMLALAVEQQVVVWDLQQHAERFQTSIQIQVTPNDCTSSGTAWLWVARQMLSCPSDF